MHLFFDLDGTLTDSSPGIIRCIQHAMTELGHAPLGDLELRGMIGRPLTTIFGTVLTAPDAETIRGAIAAFRTRFDDIGIFENSVFPGIEASLEELRSAGYTMQVVTAKPAVPAKRVLAHFGIDRFFDAVHGPELDAASCHKADLVCAALMRAGTDHRRAVMIGDHADDVLAARAHRVRAVAAGWGYGSRDELTAAAPDYIAEDVADLMRWLRSALVASGPGDPAAGRRQ